METAFFTGAEKTRDTTDVQYNIHANEATGYGGKSWYQTCCFRGKMQRLVSITG
ncbi:hypothetical protein [Fibrella forsythiae]|uniref:Uncharacterized protein n=1 Tax=Fibrella forsythiae TaxID=2817061 RepID=A0ABS3JK65_9BACT|nr:hypothetical protein [Fibrella forsythiae]MBO0950391.1 hypothetical protein [Fibrella forsythiae]